MPLIEHRKLNTTSHWGIWQIDESIEVLAAAYPLNGEEELVFHSFTHAFRKTQWLASRLLLHTLDPGTKIIYDDHGKPWPEGKKTHLSISHSGTLIAILLSESACGIDIELIRPKIERIASKFLSGTELAHAMKEPLMERLHVYWCAKETAYKMFGKKNVSLRGDIHVEEFQLSEKGTVNVKIKTANKEMITAVAFENRGAYMLSWTIGNNE